MFFIENIDSKSYGSTKLKYVAQFIWCLRYLIHEFRKLQEE